MEVGEIEVVLLSVPDPEEVGGSRVSRDVHLIEEPGDLSRTQEGRRSCRDHVAEQEVVCGVFDHQALLAPPTLWHA